MSHSSSVPGSPASTVSVPGSPVSPQSPSINLDYQGRAPRHAAVPARIVLDSFDAQELEVEEIDGEDIIMQDDQPVTRSEVVSRFSFRGSRNDASVFLDLILDFIKEHCFQIPGEVANKLETYSSTLDDTVYYHVCFIISPFNRPHWPLLFNSIVLAGFDNKSSSYYTLPEDTGSHTLWGRGMYFEK